MDRTNEFLWFGRNDNEKPELEAMNRRSQLLVFIESLEPGWIISEDFSNLEAFYTHGRITYRGVSYYGSAFHHFWNSSEFTGAGWVRDLEAAARESVDWENILLGAAGFIPKVGGFVGGVSFGSTALDSMNQADRREVVLSNAEKATLALATVRMGGGASGIQTPNGYRVVGSTEVSSDIIVNLAGLRLNSTTSHLSPGEAIVAFANDDNDYNEEVYNFINGVDGCTARRDYHREINRTLRVIMDINDSIENLYVLDAVRAIELRNELDAARVTLGVDTPLYDLSDDEFNRVVEHWREEQ